MLTNIPMDRSKKRHRISRDRVVEWNDDPFASAIT